MIITGNKVGKNQLSQLVSIFQPLSRDFCKQKQNRNKFKSNLNLISLFFCSHNMIETFHSQGIIHFSTCVKFSEKLAFYESLFQARNPKNFTVFQSLFQGVF